MTGKIIRAVIIILCLFSAQISLAAALPQLPVPQFTKTMPKKLTLQEAIMLLIRNNPELRSQYLQRVIDRFQLEIAYNEFAPQYTLGGTATYETGAPPQYQTDPKITVKTPFGSQFSIDEANQFNGSEHSVSGTVSVTQPLLQGFGRKVAQNALYTQKQEEFISRLTLKGDVMSQIVTLIQDYYQLAQDYNNLTVTKLSLKTSQENLRETQMKIKAGKTATSEAVQYQQQVAQDNFTITQTQNQIDTDYLALLTILGLDPKSKLDIVKTINISYASLPKQQQSITLALENNIDYQKALINYKLAKQAVIVAADKRKWKLNLTASATRPFEEFSPIGGNGGPTINKQAVVSLDIPIDDVTSKLGLESAKIQLKQEQISLAEEKRNLISEVINALRNLKSQREQIQLAQQTAKWGEQNLALEQTKAKYGRSTPLDVTNVQNALTSDRLQVISSQITYINTLQQFYQLLGITLKKWGITLVY